MSSAELLIIERAVENAGPYAAYFAALVPLRFLSERKRPERD